MLAFLLIVFLSTFYLLHWVHPHKTFQIFLWTLMCIALPAEVVKGRPGP